jgi:hypothetical protein
MNAAKHTPGPWHVCIDDDGNPLSGRPGVFSSEELDCGIVHWDGFKQTYWQSARGEKEMHANARLIAAAPDLLEFAEEVRRTGDTRLASMAIAAIAKATGVEQ